MISNIKYVNMLYYIYKTIIFCTASILNLIIITNINKNNNLKCIRFRLQHYALSKVLYATFDFLSTFFISMNKIAFIKSYRELTVHIYIKLQ